MSLLFILLLIFVSGLCFSSCAQLRRKPRSSSSWRTFREAVRKMRAAQFLRKKATAQTLKPPRSFEQIPGAVGTLDLLRQSGQRWTWAVSWEFGDGNFFSRHGSPLILCRPQFLAVVAGVFAGSIPYIYLLIMAGAAGFGVRRIVARSN